MQIQLTTPAGYRFGRTEPMNTDRTVHATSGTVDVVRYDRAGKWYLEPRDGSKRTKVSIQEAVDFAFAAFWNDWGNGLPFLDRPGGDRFDYLFRKLCSEERSRP